MIFFLLLFIISSLSATVCREATTNCEESLSIETKNTIEDVIADLKYNLKGSNKFFVKSQSNLQQYAVNMEVNLKTEKTLLEGILDIRESQDTQCEDRLPKNSACKALSINTTICEHCISPIYDDVTMIYTCTKNYVFDITLETRQVRCKYADGRVELVYEGDGTSELYNGLLICRPLSPGQIKSNPCPYSCAETAECSESKLECACLKGYVDVSSQYNKARGSICTKCNNSDSHGTDIVMLLDISASISKENFVKMVNFISEILTFIDVDRSENRFSLIDFDAVAHVIIPLVPKSTTQEMMGLMKAKEHDDSGSCGNYCTNTPHALKLANEVYAKIKETKNRKVTILFTDGGPNNCNSNFRGGKMQPPDSCIIDDLRKETTEMRERHQAKIITIYVGRDMDEKSVQRMRVITTENDELSVDNFDDLKEAVLDKLQTKFC